MILEFTVGYFRSFNEKKTLSFEATGIKEKLGNTFRQDGYTVLRSLAIYGANSSGKSNLIIAMFAMKLVLLSSINLNKGDGLSYTPFQLSSQLDKPTHFEILFVIDGTRYRYGFEYTSTKIEEEWLFRQTGRKREEALFVRTPDGIGVNEKTFAEGVGLEERTNDNRLFLSVVGQLNGQISNTIIEWIHTKMNIYSGVFDDSVLRDFSKIKIHENGECGKKMQAFFDDLQLGFQRLNTKKVRVREELLPRDMPIDERKKLADKEVIEMISVHNRYDEAGNIVEEQPFPIDGFESEGTKKLLGFAGPIFATLETGGVMVIDELDAKMHPLISERIIELFNDPETNPNNAQLVFTTHDTHLLSAHLLRRDQIWFTEKDATEQTDLYSMTDIVLPNGQIPRNDSNFEKNYIAGRYGAVPFIQ